MSIRDKLNDGACYGAMEHLLANMSFEDMLTSSVCFGLTTASPMQRAICRLVDGLRPKGKTQKNLVKQFVGNLPDNFEKPKEVGIFSGIRTGKSLMAAALAVYASQRCRIDTLQAGEIPRVSVVSISVDLARVIYQHLVGTIASRPLLRALMIGEPTSDSVTLRGPKGRAVEIKVVAGSRAGSSVVARWCAGLIMDEAPRMVGAEDGVINFDDMRNAVIGRLLPESQCWYIGSPWAPFGPAWEMVNSYWLKPQNNKPLIVRCPAYVLNPVWWSQERCEQLRLSDPSVYATDVMAEFADNIQTLLSQKTLESCTRSSPVELPKESGCEYVAAMDPATRGNSWTLVICTRKAERKIVVAPE